jgi:hypothetical protein
MPLFTREALLSSVPSRAGVSHLGRRSGLAFAVLAAACSDVDVTRTWSVEELPALPPPNSSIPPGAREKPEPIETSDMTGGDDAGADPGGTSGDAAPDAGSSTDAGPECTLALPEPAADFWRRGRG